MTVPPDQQHLPPSRRVFLHQLAVVGGAGLVLAGLDALGMSMASAQTAPPALGGSGAGRRVVILGAGVGGMTAAYELSKQGYDCQVLEARSFAGGRCQTARGGFSLTELGGGAALHVRRGPVYQPRPLAHPVQPPVHPALHPGVRHPA